GYQRFRNAACDCAQTSGLLLRDTFEGVQNAHHRAEQTDERGGGTDGGQTAQTALEFGVDDGLGALQSALGSLNGLAGDCSGAILVSLEFHQASGDNLGQMALLVALGDLDGFVDAAVAQGSSYGGGEGARLLAGRVVCHGAIDHDTDRPARHDEQDDDHDLRNDTHLLPERNRIPTHCATLLHDPGGNPGNMMKCCYGEVS